MIHGGYTGFVGFEIVERTNGTELRRQGDHQKLPTDNITEIPESYIHKPNYNYTDKMIDNWELYMGLSPADPDTGLAMTEEQMNAKRAKSTTNDKMLTAASKKAQNAWIPTHFVNPMQDMDYMLIEGVGKLTFTGPLMNTLTRFIIGTGFRPELELINPDPNDDDKNAEEIAKGQFIIEALNAVDAHVDSQIGFNDVSLIEKVTSLIDATNSFNRAALIFHYEGEPFEYKGVVYDEIPNGLKFAHPRDLGIIETEPLTHRLKGVQWKESFEMVDIKDMIYLWNPLISAKYHNAWFYGGSMIMPMLDAARTMRTIIGTDFPAMAKSTWAGMPVITVRPRGQTIAQKEDEYNNLIRRFVRGAPNFLLEDPNDVSFNNISFEPKVAEFQKLVDWLARYCVACVGMPQTMFFDETTSTRSTMLGKIQLALSTVINPIREQYSRQFSPQWYQRWFRVIFKDSPELLAKYRIRMVYDDLHIEKWFDKIEAVNAVDGRQPLTNRAYGELAGIVNYPNKVDKNAKVIPGANPASLSDDPPDKPLATRKKDAA